MAKKRKRSKGEAAKLEMTPMIDVVFQLLIFFIVTLKQEDILSHLDVSRPAPDPNQKKEEQVDDLLTILIGPAGYVLNGRPYRGQAGLAALDRKLTRMASFSRSVSVIIQCTGDSPHKFLVRLLNICARERMKNLSVFSL
ncbi:biopolymer transporter ExbD [PVC group bacterium]|nr:biopolymer transporter ExbD [PVC group bacterium]